METRVKRHGLWTRQGVYLIGGQTLTQCQAQGLLRLKRQCWVMESRLHHRLDVSLLEDLSRVRHPIAATVLGILRRAAHDETRAWMRRQLGVRGRTVPTFFATMKYRVGHLVCSLTLPTQLWNNPAVR